MLGAAIAAAAGMAAYPDLVAATRAMVAIERRLAPDPHNRAVYDDAFAAYVGLYPALAGTFHRLAAFDLANRDEHPAT